MRSCGLVRIFSIFRSPIDNSLLEIPFIHQLLDHLLHKLEKITKKALAVLASVVSF